VGSHGGVRAARALSPVQVLVAEDAASTSDAEANKSAAGAAAAATAAEAPQVCQVLAVAWQSVVAPAGLVNFTVSVVC